MMVWVISVGEPMPLDGDGARLHRAGLLCEQLRRRGYQVKWITSTFDHSIKKNRFSADTVVNYSDGIDIFFLKTVPYKNNVGVSRLVSNLRLGVKLWFYLKSSKKPDIVIASYPVIELALAATLYSKKLNIPVIIDVRDLWPDIFLRAFSSPWSIFFARLFIVPYFLAQRYVFNNATSLVSITSGMLKYCQEKINRNCGRDRYFYHGYPSTVIGESTSFSCYKEILAAKNSGKKVICFFGNIALPTCKLDDLFKAYVVSPELSSQYCAVFCGNGESLNYFKRIYRDFTDVYFPGFVNSGDIALLMSMADVGFLPYEPSFDFKISVPNKFIEYLSGGLPVLSCLEGEVEKIINNNSLGFFYSSIDELVELLKNKIPHLESSVRLRIRSDFLRSFSADVVYEEYVTHVEGLINEASDARL